MGTVARRRGMSLAGALLAACFCLTAQTTPKAADLTDAEMELFLRKGKVTRTKTVSTGINQTKRVTLKTPEFVHDAHYNPVDIRKAQYATPQGTEINFRDYYGYSIAAYRLDRLLGLNMIPVTIERRVAGSAGSLAWWVDDVLMMEKERYLKKMDPPDLDRWNDQMYQVRIFNELVYNTDANLGNLLITEDWTLKMIDFTRAFRDHHKLRNVDNLTRIDRRVLNGLKSLDEETLRLELKDFVSKHGIRALLARRDRIVQFFEAKITEEGESAVVCDLPEH